MIKPNTLASWSLRVLVGGSALLFVVLPFHAFLTVWGASLVGHYTALRLWPEVVLVVMVFAGLKLLYEDSKLRARFFGDTLIRVIAVYAAWSVLVGVIALIRGGVSKTALADGLILNLRFLLFFALIWMASQKTDILQRWWRRLLLGPATVVVLVGLMQRFLLPYDVLKHFGYNSNTIYPYETIDHKRAYLRVQSTLRGANPLGAYLVLVLSGAGQWLLQRRSKLWPAVLVLASAVVLFYSGSRSAMLGTALSVGLLLYINLPTARLKKLLLVVCAGFILLVAVTGVILRNNDTFQNTFFHSDEHSTSADSSDQGHAAALKGGLKDVVRHPFGHGVGGAGPASAHNPYPARIAENYFVQIAQETGWLGLALFAAIYASVALRLWARRQAGLAQLLFASLLGLTLVNLLSHAWTDDTLSYLWWGLAGIALAIPAVKPKKAK